MSAPQWRCQRRVGAKPCGGNMIVTRSGADLDAHGRTIRVRRRRCATCRAEVETVERIARRGWVDVVA